MITVGELIESLKKYPSESKCYAYEGEGIGIVILDDNDRESAFVEASP